MEIPRESWLALTVSTLVFFLVVIDVSAVNVAFPSIGDDFGTGETTLSWILSGYNVVVASLLLAAGRFADSVGRKRTFLPGVAVFMLGSLLCGLSQNTVQLVGSRVIQATGGAFVLATAIAVVLPGFPPQKRSTVIGITGGTGSLGAVFGPALGSFIIDTWNWRGIFFINVPICLLVLFLGPRLLQESKNPAATGRIDLIGVVMGTAAIALIMLGIVQSESWGIDDPRSLALIAAGAVLIPLLIRRSAHHPEPLLELDLFRYASFRGANAGAAFYSMAFTSGFLVNSLLLQRMWDLPITTTGKALMVSPLLAASISPLSGRLADRIGHRWILALGCLCSGASVLLYLTLLGPTPQVWTRFVPISLLAGVGVGSTIATWASAGISDVDPARFGTANATLRTTQQVFYALGVSIAITLLAAGSDGGGMQGFRWAWSFVAVMYLASAAVVALLFPSGSSHDRLGSPTHR